jgi:AcrR family transcriptional regulator
MSRPSQRVRVLDAFTDLVVASAPEAVTLDAVATAAGLSKGGLLYHFRSKDALVTGLLERAAELDAQDRDQARAHEDGVAAYYLRTSIDLPTRDPDLHRYTIAVYKLAISDPRAAEAVRASMTAWERALTESVGDPGTAQLLAAIGDGLYMRAIVGFSDRDVIIDLDAVLNGTPRRL